MNIFKHNRYMHTSSEMEVRPVEIQDLWVKCIIVDSETNIDTNMVVSILINEFITEFVGIADEVDVDALVVEDVKSALTSTIVIDGTRSAYILDVCVNNSYMETIAISVKSSVDDKRERAQILATELARKVKRIVLSEVVCELGYPDPNILCLRVIPGGDICPKSINITIVRKI